MCIINNVLPAILSTNNITCVQLMSVWFDFHKSKRKFLFFIYYTILKIVHILIILIFRYKFFLWNSNLTIKIIYLFIKIYEKKQQISGDEF